MDQSGRAGDELPDINPITGCSTHYPSSECYDTYVDIRVAKWPKDMSGVETLIKSGRNPTPAMRLLSKMAAAFPDAAERGVETIENHPLPLEYALISNNFCYPELMPLLKANPQAWLAGNLLSVIKSWKAAAVEFILAGTRPELLLLGAADAGHADAGRYLVAEHGATGTIDVISGAGHVRRANDVGSRSSNTDASKFFGSLGAFLGRYRINDGPSVHKSSTSKVYFAKDTTDKNAEVCVKMMKLRDQFESELNSRFVDGSPLSIEDVIGVLRWHTPQDEAFTDPAGKTQEAESSSGKYPRTTKEEEISQLKQQVAAGQ